MRLVLALLATACARPTVREIRNLAEYDRLIQHHKTETGLPVVVDFYSDSCGPCRMIAPAFKKLAKEMKDTNLQVHCVHPGHVGTNIASSAKHVESKEGEPSTLLGKKFSVEEQGKMFKENGMHPSRAAKIILNGVRKKKTRIFVGLDAKLLDLSQRFFPVNYQKTWPLIFLPMMARNQMLKKPLPDLPSEP